MHVENKNNLILDGRFNNIVDTVNFLYVQVFHYSMFSIKKKISAYSSNLFLLN